MAKTFGKKKFRVIRGYRNEGAVYASLPFDPANANFEFGDPVALDVNGNVVKATTADQNLLGFVVDDPDAPNNSAIKKVTVLFSGFIAETQKYNATSSYVPGAPITVKNGQVDVADLSASPADVVIGHVVEVKPDSIVFIVK